MVVLTVEEFGKLESEVVKKYTWKTSSGLSISAISYGVIIQSIQFPDKDGETSDIVLGFDDLNSYVNRNRPLFGAVIGRCANDIGGASFDIDGATYRLANNTGGVASSHGGIVGFDKVNWNSIVDGKKVIFSYFSKDMEEGYPGNLVATVSCEVTDDGALHMGFQAYSDKKTVVNLTNHSYFNLAGHETGAGELYNHIVAINADKITETDSNSIPTGRLLSVGDTPFDLRIPTRLGNVLNMSELLFDDNFCVTTNGNKGLNFVSRVTHPPSGRSLEVYSNQPGVQFYTANYLPAPDQPAIEGKRCQGYRSRGAFCLETQNYPDAVHHENFPTPILKPGELYDHTVVYKFGVEKKTISGPRVMSA